jgi:tetratricopeptide (TPR) repeat protein
MLRTTLIAAALLVSWGLAAQPKTDDVTGQGVKTFKRAEEKAAAPSGPGAAASAMPWSKKQARELEALDNEIQAVQQLIEMSDSSDVEVPDYYMRVADLFWEKSLWFENEIYSETLALEIDRAESSGDPAAIATAKAKKEEYKSQMERWRNETVATYKKVADKYPNAPNVDVVYYYLGVYLSAMNRMDDGREYFIRVVTEFPKSRLFPDALYNIGDSFFRENDFESALKFYERVEIFTDSHVFLLALYKKAWCYFNMGEYETSFKTFVRTVKATEEWRQKTGKARMDLRDEALRDLVLCFSQVGKPDNALKAFQQIAPDKYLELSQRLAQVYFDQGNYDKSNTVLKWLMKENPDSYKLLTYQRMVIDNAHKKGELNRTVDETQRLVGLYDKLGPTAPPDALKVEKDLFSHQVRELATSFHETGRTTMNDKILNMAHLLYEVYFQVFPDDAYVHDMTTNYAVLLLTLKMYDKAARYFERLLATPNLTPEQEKMAAHGAVECYFRIYDISTVKAAPEEDVEELKSQEVPDNFKRFIDACDRYVARAKAEDDDYVESKFAAAKILFDYNHFSEAAPRFSDIVVAHETSDRAGISARLLLASYNLGHDVDNLNKWAGELKKHPAVLNPELLAVIKKIEDQAEFNRCFAYEQDKAFEKAALCFLQYTQKFPDSQILDKALYNSAINYNRARMMEKAITALGELYNRARASDIAPSAIYAIAEIYREAAVYSEAAKFYEIYVANHPKHRNVEKALQYASVFRKALGDYDVAIKDYNLFMQRFSKSEKIANVDFDIGLIYMQTRKFQQAISHFEAFARKNAGNTDLVLAARLQIAKAWTGLKDKKKSRKAYDDIVSLYNGLDNAGREKLTFGIATVAEAKFLLGELILDEYREVKLTAQNLEKALTEKLEIINRAKNVFHEVYLMSQPNWMIASLDRLGWAYQQLADTIENAPLPRTLTEDQLEIYKVDLAEKAEKIRANAVDAYKKCLEEAVAFKWFNEYSGHAEQNLGTLDYSYKFTRENRSKPVYAEPGGAPFDFVRAKLSSGLEL